MKFDKYKNGLDMNSFMHIPEISVYNYNYYVGYNKDLLLGISDDDNTTEWYLVHNEFFNYLGESYTSERELLHRYESKQT